jgi:hypothetical protein
MLSIQSKLLDFLFRRMIGYFRPITIVINNFVISDWLIHMAEICAILLQYLREENRKLHKKATSGPQKITKSSKYDTPCKTDGCKKIAICGMPGSKIGSTRMFCKAHYRKMARKRQKLGNNMITLFLAVDLEQEPESDPLPVKI